jgi:hypothetical protein
VWALIPAAGRYAWGVQNIEAMQVDIGRWVAANTPSRARLAVNGHRRHRLCLADARSSI